MESQTKRKRSRQFSHDETTRLLCFVEDEQILTSKKTDVATNSAKDEAWKRLCTKFNAVGTYPRELNALRLKWDNLKKAAKKRSTAITINNRATGGGPSEIVPDAVLDKVIGLTSVSCFEVPNDFDDDAEIVTNPVLDNIVIEMATEEGQNSTSADRSVVLEGEPSRWKNWTPAELRTPVTKQLHSTSNKYKNNRDKLIQSKIERNNAIAKYFKVKLQTLKNKHNDISDSD